MTKILDIPKIQKTIVKKHSEFITSMGDIANKVSADHELTIARMASKISRILDCFIEAKAIDKFTNLEEPPFKGFHLVKLGFQKSVYIWTDGKDIVIRGSDLLIKHGLGNSNLQTIYNVDVDKYNWEDFATTLLDYIHEVVYDRKESADIRVFGMYRKEEKD